MILKPGTNGHASPQPNCDEYVRILRNFVCEFLRFRMAKVDSNFLHSYSHFEIFIIQRLTAFVSFQSGMSPTSAAKCRTQLRLSCSCCSGSGWKEGRTPPLSRSGPTVPKAYQIAANIPFFSVINPF